MATLGEFEIIERFFRRAHEDPDVLIGIGDDAAVLNPQGPVAVTVDTQTAGVHFPDGFAADALGHRALAVNLSDIAAMGGTPRWCTLALTIPDADEQWLDAFTRGFFSLAERYGIALVGGNVSRGPLSVSVQVLGTLAGERFLTRAGGRPGDDLYVTGTLGDAAAGLAILGRRGSRSEEAAWLVGRFTHPTPRIEAGQALASLASAAIDVSDGLAADMGHLIESSVCGAIVEVDDLPLSDALRAACAAPIALEHSLSGGDDYELCFAAPPDMAEAIEAELARLGTRVTRIGRLVEGSTLAWRRGGEPFVARDGYRHF